MQDTATLIHRSAQGTPDYVLLLTLDFLEEAGQWVGVCQELGTAAQSDTLEQARDQLREAVELQLGEMERFCGAEGFQDYLAENYVRILPITLVDQMIGQRQNMTPEQIRKDLGRFGDAGRKWREDHPDEYDVNYPPSIAWQDELYDEYGLPK